MNIIYAFDVDGVLCDTGKTIDPEFKDWFLNWIGDKPFVLVTGSELEKTLTQLGPEIVNKAKVVFNCMGNSIHMYGKKTLINQFTLKQEEREFLESVYQNSTFPHKTGNHVVQREGSLNFSVAGRNASPDIRQLYKVYDKTFNDRLRIKEEFVKRFPRFEAFIGGDISIDICLRGANKGIVYDLIPRANNESIYFFADRIQQDGIDKPFADRCDMFNRKDSVFEVNGYESTREILKTL